MPKPLPKSREARVRLLQKSSTQYIRRMGRVEIDKLLYSLSRTKGLSVDERREEVEGRFNVAWEFVPDRFKE